MKTHSEKFERQRKLYTAFPVLVTPFLVMLFWSLDGGEGVKAKEIAEQGGLNTELPNPKLSDNANTWDKLSLYNRAQRDSLKKAEAERTDPYFRLETMTEMNNGDSLGLVNYSLGEKKIVLDSNEAIINQKISEINNAIAKPGNRVSSKKENINLSKEHAPEVRLESQEVDRLEEMMLMMQNEGTADPEMAQIESVLEKILDVQHPERVREKLQEQSEKRPGKIFSVTPAGNEVQTGVFDARGFTEIKNNGFIRIDDAKHEAGQNAVKALIHSTESLEAGSTIKIRLLDDIFLNGELLTHNDFVFGTCDIQGDRLLIKISSILSNGSIFNVNLSAYDLDGQEGLYIPGTVANEASKQMTNQAMQDLQLLSADPSIGAQAASAGIQTAKTLIGKKTRAIKVQVKSGYRIFLKDKNQKQ